MRRRELIVIALAFLLTLPAVTTRFYASDEIQYFAWLHSWFFDRDVDFENEYLYFYDNGTVHTAGFHETFLERQNEAGRRFNFAPIGTAVLWTPFYAAGHVVAGATGVPQDGLSRPYVSAVAYGSAFYGACALVLSLLVARALTGTGTAATLWVAAGTPLLFYMYIAPGFSHACSAFAVSLFLWTWLRVREAWTPLGAAALGATGALMAMVREQDLFFLIPAAIDFLCFAWTARHTAASSLARTALVGATTCVVTYTPQLLAYNALNGHPSQTEAVGRKMIWTSPHALQVLFSPEHGFVLWTPLGLVAIAGLVVWLLARRDRSSTAVAETRLRVLLLLAVALQIYVSGAVDSWTAAGSFGQRRLVALTPLLVVGLAWLQISWPHGRRALVRRTVLVLCVWWHVGLMAQFGLNAMDRQRLTLAENARWTFLTLPRLAPSLAWRYAFDRSSFYRAPRN